MQYRLLIGKDIVMSWSLDSEIEFSIEARPAGDGLSEALWIDIVMPHAAADDVLAYVANTYGHDSGAWSDVKASLERVPSTSEPMTIAQGYLRRVTSRRAQ